ncbi:basic salivary proline-rich protein 2-like [Calypte anna]|uniref:basic salivary proline-rich protein 2-like n=1 Tax=Calypte anna TaxID=9244 RepID=UPI0011C375AA|nr:basic salivary proline-rich protein 2-like [Calypte anna]
MTLGNKQALSRREGTPRRPAPPAALTTRPAGPAAPFSGTVPELEILGARCRPPRSSPLNVSKRRRDGASPSLPFAPNPDPPRGALPRPRRPSPAPAPPFPAEAGCGGAACPRYGEPGEEGDGKGRSRRCHPRLPGPATPGGPQCSQPRGGTAPLTRPPPQGCVPAGPLRPRPEPAPRREAQPRWRSFTCWQGRGTVPGRAGAAAGGDARGRLSSHPRCGWVLPAEHRPLPPGAAARWCRPSSPPAPGWGRPPGAGRGVGGRGAAAALPGRPHQVLSGGGGGRRRRGRRCFPPVRPSPCTESSAPPWRWGRALPWAPPPEQTCSGRKARRNLAAATRPQPHSSGMCTADTARGRPALPPDQEVRPAAPPALHSRAAPGRGFPAPGRRRGRRGPSRRTSHRPQAAPLEPQRTGTAARQPVFAPRRQEPGSAGLLHPAAARAGNTFGLSAAG